MPYPDKKCDEQRNLRDTFEWLKRHNEYRAVEIVMWKTENVLRIMPYILQWLFMWSNATDLINFFVICSGRGAFKCFKKITQASGDDLNALNVMRLDAMMIATVDELKNNCR